MGLILGILIAVGVIVALVRYAAWASARRVRFAFEDRDTYLFLKLERLLTADDPAVVTMRALREALRLKLTSGYTKLLVETSELRIANAPGFWLLVGALGPALIGGTVKVALACGNRTNARRYFRESGIVDPFDSESKALAFLKSSDPARPVILDPEWCESLLVAKGPRPLGTARRGVAPRSAGSRG